MLVKQSRSFSRKHRILSLQVCVRQTVHAADPETWTTTKFGDWCRNVCTLYMTPVLDTSDLMQCINDTWASISQNIETVGQCRKRLCTCMKAKGHHFEYLLNYGTVYDKHIRSPDLSESAFKRALKTHLFLTARHYWDVLMILAPDINIQIYLLTYNRLVSEIYRRKHVVSRPFHCYLVFLFFLFFPICLVAIIFWWIYCSYLKTLIK